MRQFINGSDEAFSNLERQARENLIGFFDQEMPAGAKPERAKVGFKVNHDDGSAVLFVERGVSYEGPDEDVCSWLRAGEKRFSSFTELKDWIRHTLASSYVQCANHPSELCDPHKVRTARRSAFAWTGLQDQMFSQLSKHVRGQDDALRVFCEEVCQHLDKPYPRRPVTLFAVGPTGVGKTETAESLRQTLTALDPDGAGYSYLRLDMNLYTKEHEASRLFGAAPSYIGYGEGGVLVNALQENGKRIVLFDEISRAHPGIWPMLMNAMDAGRLPAASVSRGAQEVECGRAIFIFTSNFGAQSIIQELSGRNAFGDRWKVSEVCRRHLRAAGIAPELLGRIRQFLVYRPLSERVRVEIIILTVARVAAEYGLKVARIAPSVVEKILENAGGSEFGARPDDYLVDNLLGRVFAQAAAGQIKSPVEVCGPPFKCIPLTSNN